MYILLFASKSQNDLRENITNDFRILLSGTFCEPQNNILFINLYVWYEI